MKFLVTGVGGQLGYDVVQELLKRGHECIGTDILDECENIKTQYIKLDITDKESVTNAIVFINPDCVVHCAAWTAVDLAEDKKEDSSDEILDFVDCSQYKALIVDDVIEEGTQIH
jgi:dTDP-4-dehydrorhamnose reductase